MKIGITECRHGFKLIYVLAIFATFLGFALIKPAYAQTPCPTCENVVSINCGNGVAFPKVRLLAGETAALAKLRKCSNKVPVICWNKQKKWGPANLAPDVRADKVCPPKQVKQKCKNGRIVWMPEKFEGDQAATEGFLAAACKRQVVYRTRTRIVVRKVPHYAPPSRPRPGDHGNARCRCK